MRARSFATARLSALLRGYALRFVTPTRPGPRFLESPDANGRTLSDASAAGTLQSDHAPDGTMPRPPTGKSDELHPQEPLPLRQSASPVDVPYEERDGCLYSERVEYVKEFIPLATYADKKGISCAHVLAHHS